MKTLTLVLCFFAVFAATTAQSVTTPVFIQNRAKILANSYSWFQKLDASYFRVYNNLKSISNKIFNFYPKVYADLNAAHENLNVADLDPIVQKDFDEIFQRINQTVFHQATYGAQYSLMMTGGMMTSMDLLTPAAAGFKQTAFMPINSLFTQMSMNSMMTPISEECLNETLSQIIPTYEPFAQSLLQSAENGIAQIPAVFANATLSSSETNAILRGFIQKINLCARNVASKSFCVSLINYENSECNLADRCVVENSIYRPTSEFSMAMMNFNQVYSTYGMMMPSMDMHTKISDLQYICSQSRPSA